MDDTWASYDPDRAGCEGGATCIAGKFVMAETTAKAAGLKGAIYPSQKIAELIEENARLRRALTPFANAVRTEVVQDVLSFGKNAPPLTVSRGFGSVKIDAWAFSEALKLA